jgi:acetyl esterase/lipase
MLTYSLICLVAILISIKPFKVPLLQVIFFFVGWLVSELPIHFAVITSLGFIYFALSVQNYSAYFYGSLAAFVLALVGCVFNLLQGIKSSRVLKQALNLDIWPHTVSHKILKIATVIPLAPISNKDFTGINYWGDSNYRHEMDIFIPHNLKGLQPAVLFIHGGAWFLGNKENQGLPLSHAVLGNGMIFARSNYRLSPKATWPEHIIDVKRAICYLKENAEVYGIDRNKIFISGGSAGGQLAALAALSPNYKEFQPGFEDMDSSVAGCLSLYGVYDMANTNKNQDPAFLRLLETVVFKTKYSKNPKIFHSASPLSYMTTKIDHFIAVHGQNDSLVNVKDTRLFIKKLSENSHIDLKYVELPYAQHAFEVFWSFRSITAVEALAYYLKQIST